MKRSLVAGLLSFIGSVGACGGATLEGETRKEPPPAPTTEVPDAGETPPVIPASCSVPLVDPKCATTSPAPTSSAAVSKFVQDTGIPLRCSGANGGAFWDLRPLVNLYGAQKMFMIGEVHGSNEIGIVSALLLRDLASKQLVNVLGFELPMDLEESFEAYVQFGKDPMAEQVMDQFAENFFGSILTKTARDLAETKGIRLRVAAVDVPMQPDSAAFAIQKVAAKLTTQKDVVLATLPTSASYPPSPSDIAKANAYFDLIQSKKSEICTELSADDCERLVAMTHALWASTLAYDKGASDSTWLERREELIYYNMKSKMAAPTDRMFLHMGAAHTNKFTSSAGSRMAKEYAPTKGLVFSVGPAWGDGSVIHYGQNQDLPAEPLSIVNALTDAPPHPVFVSTTRPSANCEANPIGEEPDTLFIGSGTRGELYDGYIHYGKLTSETSPDKTKLSTKSGQVGGKTFAKLRARIEERERAGLAAGALGRRGSLGP